MGVVLRAHGDICTASVGKGRIGLQMRLKLPCCAVLDTYAQVWCRRQVHCSLRRLFDPYTARDRPCKHAKETRETAGHD